VLARLDAFGNFAVSDAPSAAISVRAVFQWLRAAAHLFGVADITSTLNRGRWSERDSRRVIRRSVVADRLNFLTLTGENLRNAILPATSFCLKISIDWGSLR
jgi:hypothetical protein